MLGTTSGGRLNGRRWPRRSLRRPALALLAVVVAALGPGSVGGPAVAQGPAPLPEQYREALRRAREHEEAERKQRQKERDLWREVEAARRAGHEAKTEEEGRQALARLMDAEEALRIELDQPPIGPGVAGMIRIDPFGVVDGLARQLPPDVRARMAVERLDTLIGDLSRDPECPGEEAPAETWTRWVEAVATRKACLLAASDLGEDLFAAGASNAALETFEQKADFQNDPKLAEVFRQIDLCIVRGKRQGKLPRGFDLEHEVYHRALPKKHHERQEAGLPSSFVVLGSRAYCQDKDCELRRKLEERR
jgi:hypothetical protein